MIATGRLKTFSAMKCRLWACLCVLVLLWATSLARAEVVSSSGQVLVGVVAGEAPMQAWAEGATEPQGYDVDLIRQLADHSGLRVHFKRFATRAELYAAVKASEVDMVASATMMPLAANLAITRPYRVERHLMVSRQAVTSLPGNPDLAGRRLAVVAGSSGAAAAKQLFPLAQTATFPNLEDAISAVKRGQSDLLLAGRPQLLTALQGSQGVRVLKTYTLPEGQLRLAVRPEARSLLERFDDLLSVRSEEEDAALAQRWLTLPDAPVLSVSPLRANQPGLRVGYFPRHAHGRLLADGAPSGIGVDLMKAVASHAGFTIAEFKPVNLPRGVQGLQDGSIDVLLGLTETELRRASLSFVGPYHESLLAIISRTGYSVPSLDELKGRRLAMIRRFFAHDFVVQTFPGVEIVECDNSDICLDWVESGEADATVYPMTRLQERLDARGAALQITGVLPHIQHQDNLSLGPHSAHLAQRLRAGLDLAMAQDLAAIEQKHAESRLLNGLNWRSLAPWGLGIAVLVAVAALGMWWHLMLLRNQVAAKQQAREQAEAYLGFMTHEVRNALQSVAGASVLLNELEDEADAPPGERKKVLQLMTRSSRSTMTLMDALMDRYRYVQGKVVVKAEDVDLAEILRQLVEDIQPAAHAKRLSLDFSCDPWAAGQWRVDPVRVQQVLRNLIINAVKFTREGGITVHLGTDGEAESMLPTQLRIAVSDSGDGMDEATRKQAFERFHSKGGDRPGTGLGLALCRDLAQAMGGELVLESAAGRGSKFTLVFEACRPAYHSIPPETEVTLRKVLIVDSSPVYGLLLKRALGNAGVESVLVESVRAVVDEITRPAVAGHDLVLVESTLIDGTCDDVIDELQRRFGDMPYVVVLDQGVGGSSGQRQPGRGVLETMAKTSDVYGLVDRIMQVFESAQTRRVEWGGLPSRPHLHDHASPQSQL